MSEQHPDQEWGRDVDINSYRINELEKRLFKAEGRADSQELMRVSQESRVSDLQTSLVRIEERLAHNQSSTERLNELQQLAAKNQEMLARTEERLAGAISYGRIFLVALYALVPVVFAILLKQNESIARTDELLKLAQTRETKRVLEEAATFKSPAEVERKAEDVRSTLESAAKEKIVVAPPLVEAARSNLRQYAANSKQADDALRATSAYAQSMGNSSASLGPPKYWPYFIVGLATICALIGWHFYRRRKSAIRVLFPSAVTTPVAKATGRPEFSRVLKDEYVIRVNILPQAFLSSHRRDLEQLQSILKPGARVIFTKELIERHGTSYRIVTVNDHRYGVKPENLEEVRNIIADHAY